MNAKIRDLTLSGQILSILISVLALLTGTDVCTAQTPAPEQKANPCVYIVSKSDVTPLSAGDDVVMFHEVEAALISQLKDNLLTGDLRVNIVQSEQEAAADPAGYLLLVTVEKVELEQVSTVGVRCQFKNKERRVVIDRAYEEKSFSKWRNCVKKISEMIATDIGFTMDRIIEKEKNQAEKAIEVKPAIPDKPVEVTPAPAGTPVQVTPAAADKPAEVKPAPPVATMESRLQKLKSLRAKGLITQEEYAAKKKEILNEL